MLKWQRRGLEHQKQHFLLCLSSKGKKEISQSKENILYEIFIEHFQEGFMTVKILGNFANDQLSIACEFKSIYVIKIQFCLS